MDSPNLFSFFDFLSPYIYVCDRNECSGTQRRRRHLHIQSQQHPQWQHKRPHHQQQQPQNPQPSLNQVSNSTFQQSETISINQTKHSPGKSSNLSPETESLPVIVGVIIPLTHLYFSRLPWVNISSWVTTVFEDDWVRWFTLDLMRIRIDDSWVRSLKKCMSICTLTTHPSNCRHIQLAEEGIKRSGDVDILWDFFNRRDWSSFISEK